MGDERRPGILTRIMDHPMGKLLAGFLLTGVIGQSLTWAHSERQEKVSMRRGALESIREFTSLEDALLQAADRLRDSIVLGAPPDHVARRANDYYAASVRWGAARDANNFRFREYFGFTGPNFLEVAGKDGLSPILRMIDGCLSTAAIAVATDDAGSAPRTLTTCDDQGIDALIAQANQCSHALAATMTEFVMMGLECGDDRWRNNGRAVYDRIMTACGEEADAPQGSIWPYGESGEKASEYDNACIRDDSWFHRLHP